jgi:hypothetical protein
MEEQLPEYRQYPDTNEDEPPPSSPLEQERLNVMASAMPAASRGLLNTPLFVIFENIVFIFLSPF